MSVSTPDTIRNGITIKHHPGRLSDGDLNWLRVLAEQHMIMTAPRLAQWLRRHVESEEERRLIEADEEASPIEVEMPVLPVSGGWSDGDVGEALIASDCALRCAGDHPEAEKFLRELRTVTAAWAAHRLRTRVTQT